MYKYNCKLVIFFSSIYQPLAYGTNAVPLPILYLVSYSGINITADSNTVMSSPHVFTLPAVDGSVIVSVTAYNDFGSGGTSLGVQDTISKSQHAFCNPCK